MSSQSKVIELLKGSASILQGESSYLELSKLCQHISLEQAFQFCREGMNRLSEMERFDVWHHARKNRDRLAGILCVAELNVMGEARILVGFVDLDQVAACFVRENYYSLDGRSIDAHYPG